jgi:acyl carrier protein
VDQVVVGGSEVETVVVETLAGLYDESPDVYREQLARKGAELPIDSFDVVDVMLELEERFDIRFPDTTETCEAFRSVTSLATQIRQLMSAAKEVR